MRFLNKIILCALCSFSILATDSVAKKKIGIISFSSETRYENATQGFLEVLKKNGFDENKVSIIKENAGANKAQVIEIINKFKTEKLDLIYSIGTSSTTLIASEITDTPVVFAIVYNPIESGIAKSWKSSGNNTTGISVYIPMDKVLAPLSHFPSLKKLAVLYTPNEKNSESQLKDIQASVQNKLVIIPVPLTNKEDIDVLLPEILRTSDALYVTGSNVVNKEISLITEMAMKAKVVTITHLDDLVTKGVLIGVSSNSKSMGEIAGTKAVKILRGTKPKDIPIDIPKNIQILFNEKKSKEGHFIIPENFLKTVTIKL